MSKYTKTMRDALAEMSEAFSKKQIKMAIGIASDPRYKQGNYSGAYRQIEKIKKGLADHPQVAAVLKRQNEEIFEKVKCPHCEGDGCLKCEGNGYMTDAVDKEDEPFLKDLIKNLRKGSATHGKQADDLEKAVKEETELDEMKEPFAVVDTADGNKVVGTASDERGAKEIITTAQLPPMKIKDKKTLKIVKVKKKQDIGYPLKEGTWALPDSPKAKAELKKLMSKPIKLGKEGDDATDIMYSLIGDDELFDDLYVAGKKNPNGDARPVIKKAMKRLGIKEEVELDERKFEAGKSASGYDIFHKDFSSAMQHATAFAKSKGQPIKKDEIDNKVATGPRKPSAGKENSYTLETEKGKRWSVQVYNMGSKFELNMYLTSSYVPEEVELDEKFKVGDKVKVKKGSLKSPSQRHYERTVGTIVKVYSDGDLKVNFGGNDDFSAPDKMFVKEEIDLDEGKMKAIAMKIDSIVAKMKKDKNMKGFADKFKKEASKTLDIAKSLEKVLPDYIAGKDIAALVKEETIVESWELDEMKMDDPKLLKIFDKLKKGSTVKIKIDSSISKGKDYREFTVTAKNIVGKGKKFEQEKITLKAKDNPTGVKHFLYNRDDKVTLAIGDMGASIADIKEDNIMSAYTAAITKQLGER